MQEYQEIDALVKCYKAGRKGPRNSPERENARAAGQLLLITFKPLVLSVLSQCPVPENRLEDGFQDGCVAFMEGLNKFDPGCGSPFNAFIKAYLRRYFMKWRSGQFNRSVSPSMTLDTPVGQGLTLLEVVADGQTDIEGGHLRAQSRQDWHSRLRRGLAALTQRQKQVVYCHYQKGVPLLQIARELGLSPSTVRSYHERALKKIKKFL
ncbi:sigma-70 family RNA polymerase sigma factor [Eubacterium sp. 1001713B170207_170306_E7]|uniref:sigma-70 family RNA polymerase sigma factor n=1 Tax=Eubacterium sp. 1001713B170207_170306_E7 TaxID=2787097 RepID=UPI0018978445|nr:sigma-70 family RNA polymerase sigma factor [Eubacterium sp. 1001713B170207_170306_E7]